MKFNIHNKSNMLIMNIALAITSCWHKDSSTGISENVLSSLYDGKLGTVASDIMYVKPFICVVGK